MRALVLEKTNEIRPLITDVFPFEEGIRPFDFATRMPASSVKVQIELGV